MPWTSKVVEGVVVRIPTRLFWASIDKVLVSKEKPLTPPERVRLVSLAKVQASALEVTVSPVASPKVTLPVIEALPLIFNWVPTIAWALRPLEMRREPEKELDPVLTEVKVPEIEALPPNDAVPLVSRSPEIRTSLDAEM